MQRAETLFFDLDGTLTDPKEGITRSIQFALEQMGLAVPPADDLLHFIGPPLRDSFEALIGADKSEIAVRHYRQRYDVEGLGLKENVVYPNILEVLTLLNQQGKKLFVVTAKPHPIARRIIQHFEIDHLFQEIYGPEIDGTRNNKGDLITYILVREKLLPEKIIMIGDRKHDVLAAAQNNIRSIGVTWGYGSLEELQSAGAHMIVHAPEELLEILLPPKG